MLRNQKGFGLVEGLLILVIVGMIGGVGYYVYNSQKQTKTSLDKTAQLAQSTQSTPSSTSGSEFKLPDGWVWYENSKVGVKFAHPEAWAPQTDDNLSSNSAKGPSFSILVKDGEASDSEIENINIRIYPKQDDDRTVDTFLSSQLAEVSDAKEINLDGIRAVQFTWQTKPDAQSDYYPNPYLGTFVANGGFKYYISYTYKYGSTPSKYLSSYNDIIKSFQFI